MARGVAEAAEWLGGIDVVVNNAGSGLFGVVEACTLEDFRVAMDVNYFGTVAMCQATLQHLRAARCTLINVASIAGREAFGGTAAYSASKHAVVGLSESLHDEQAQAEMIGFLGKQAEEQGTLRSATLGGPPVLDMVAKPYCMGSPATLIEEFCVLREIGVGICDLPFVAGTPDQQRAVLELFGREVLPVVQGWDMSRFPQPLEAQAAE